MKTLSIRQPWASLIVNGVKDIENRTWKCPKKCIGQRVLIHASMGWNKDLAEICLGDLVKRHLENIRLIHRYDDEETGYKGYSFSFPHGAIIGSVEIVDCVVNHPSIWAEKTKGIRVGDVVPYKNTRGNIKNAEIKSFETVESGKIWFRGIDVLTNAKVWYPAHVSLELMKGETIYNWVLAHPRLFPEPIPAKGNQGFWNYPNILAEPEEEDGELFCHCQLPVKERNQVYSFINHYRCNYCGGRWYK